MTFIQYAESIFKILELFFLFFKRIDIVFDVYLSNSLKVATQRKRGKEIRRRVSSEGKCPSNWMMFLKEEQNKDELNGFLATTLTAMTYSEGKELPDLVKKNCCQTVEQPWLSVIMRTLI